MLELYKVIEKKTGEFHTDFFRNVVKGNKAAGRRARKASLELEKLLKEYRKKSIEADKE